MSRPAPRFKDALDVFARHGVDFVVVGGVAAVLAGAPISTFDLDIVPARSPENLVKLVAALSEIDARYRDLTGRVLRPDAEALAGPGHHLLLTTCGPVDVLGTIGLGDGYDQLLADVVERKIGDPPRPYAGPCTLDPVQGSGGPRQGSRRARDPTPDSRRVDEVAELRAAR